MKNNKISLDKVTLVSVACVDVEDTLRALKYSSKDINFNSVKLITSYDIIDDSVQIIKCRNLDYEGYNYFVLYELWEYIDTDYALIIQNDGFVIDAYRWRDEFLDYDYIGAPWPIPNDNVTFRDVNGNLQRVGNGGFSLRSKKVLELPNKLNLEWKKFNGYYNEDGFICVNYRHIFDEHGCKIAPIDVAKYFSHETIIPEILGIEPFGFHGKMHYYNALKYTI
jgi:hypothetical protein